MQITKSNFPKYVDLTLNLDDVKLQPYIEQSYEMDVKPLLGYETAKALQEWEGPVDTEIVVELNDDTNTFVFYPASIEPTAMDALWAVVMPFWVLAAYYRHMAAHGINHTQSGFTENIGNNFQHISDKRRAEYMALKRSDRNAKEDILRKYIKTYYSTTENDTCRPEPRRSRFGFKVANSDRKERDIYFKRYY